ncbi:MAG: amidohydrolase family protein [Clostridiaceae bacterium]|nr:amidohydrolase family protein [Clostridiaceae bacterium]
MKIIDIHCHIFPEKIANKAVKSIGDYYNISMYGEGTISDLKVQGEKAGIDKFVVHSTATKPEQVKSINDFIAGIINKNSNCIGFATLHPGLVDIEAEIERVMLMGLRGIKLHPDFQGFNIDDEGMMPIYKALEGRLIVLMHMGDENSDASSPQRLARVLDMFPRLTVIAAHLGGYSMWRESMEYLVGRNVYFDTSSSLAFLSRDRAKEMIRKHGVHKVLFGSDYPMWSPLEELERFMNLGFTPEEQNKILWENSSALLKLCIE